MPIVFTSLIWQPSIENEALSTKVLPAHKDSGGRFFCLVKN